MLRLAYIAALALAATTVSFVARADDPPTPTFANVTVHDPSVMRTGDTYYVYGSHLVSASTQDLIGWTQISTSAAVGNPLVPNPPVTFSEVLSWAQTNTFWAPDCIRLGDGRYYLYYCACRGDSPLSAMGLAVSDSPTGPFSHVAVLLRSGMSGTSEDGTTYNATVHPNVVDPAVFFDQAGKLWMVYGSYSGGIYIMEMDPATGLQKPGQGYGKKLIGKNHSRIEGAYIIYSPESEYYYMFLSFGGLDASGGYNIRLARSRNPDGPYLDAAGNDLTTVGGPNGSFFDDAAIAPYGVKLMGNYQFATAAGETGTSRGYLSPGHNSAYYDPASDQYFLVFHTRFTGRGEQHEVRVHQMFVNADDWLVVAPHRYARETIAPTDAGRIVGNYKLINHGKDITATVKTSSAISLLADGSVTGSTTGTWQLAGDHDATLALAGTTYRGVFVRQWDDDRQRWLPAFTAVSDGGVAVWGSKVAINTAPAILTQPASQTGLAGGSLVLRVIASGEPVPAYQWLKDGVNIDGANSSTLELTGLAPSDAGAYTVLVSNPAGSVTSAAATVTVDAQPIISSHPASLTQAAGTTAGLAVTASGSGSLAYQWFKDGAALPAATASTLTFASLQASDAGEYTVRVTDDLASTTSRFARIVVASPVVGRIANLSVRSTAGIGGNALIVGFVVSGGEKDILVRAVGPTLAAFDVSGTMNDPGLNVFAKVNDVDAIVASNDNWADNGQAPTLSALFATLGAFPFSSETSRDAAIITTVSGSRTVHVNSMPPAQPGVVLVECYDATTSISPRLVNISARNFAGTDSQTLIAGFVIDGNTPKRLLIRGVGPTLADYGVGGVLENPRLAVYQKLGDADRLVAANEDWPLEPGVEAASSTAGAFALRAGSGDAALVLTLPAGVYTAHVSGTASTTGEALVEVYELP